MGSVHAEGGGRAGWTVETKSGLTTHQPSDSDNSLTSVYLEFLISMHFHETAAIRRNHLPHTAAAKG